METNRLLDLLDKDASPATIVKIITDSKYEASVCKKGVELLQSQGWKENNFLDLLERSSNPEPLLKACLSFLTLKEMDKNQIFKFLAANNYHRWLDDLAINALPLESFSQDEFILILSKFDSELVYSMCWLLMELKDKTEDELADLLKKLGSNYNAKKMIAPYFKTRQNLLPIIEMLDRDDSEKKLLEVCFERLELDKLSDAELIDLVKESKDCSDLCHEVINHFKLQSSLWWVIAYYEYNASVVALVIPKMEDENLIMIAVEKNITNTEVLIAAIPKLSEVNIMLIWGKNRYEKRIYQVIADNLPLAGKTETDLINIIVLEKTGSLICEACKPYLDLKAISSSSDSMIAFLKKTGFCQNACQTFLPLLKPQELPESQIFALVKKSGLNENVCKNLMPFISSDKYVIEIVRTQMYYDHNFWVKPFSDLLSEKSDDEILEIVKSLHNYLEACKIAVNYLKGKAALTEICMRTDYNEEIMKIAKAKANKI